MRQAVKDIFFDFSVGHEGFTPFMYCDILNLVTTGIGNLIDKGPRNGFAISNVAMAPAMGLPWKFKGAGWTSKNPVAADIASQADIREAWIRTKLKEQEIPGFNKGGGFAYAGLTPLTLDMEGLKTLFNRTLVSFENTIRTKNPNWESWPADAQLAMLSMAWAMGPAFTDKFKAMKIALDRGDFASAGAQSRFTGGDVKSGGKLSRNEENVIMFKNAADVVKGGVDPNRLFFPGTVATSAGILPSPKDVIGPVAVKTKTLGERAIQIGTPIAAIAVIGAVGYSLYELNKEKGWI